MERLITKELLSWKNAKYRKPLLVTGVRQVGKTYILREFGARNFSKYHYVNFEKEPLASKIFEKDLKPNRIIDDLSFYLDCPIDIEKELIILDEIQSAPKALTSLKYFQEDLPELCICAAGSLLGVHLGSFSFPVGKVSMLSLHPMSFEEFLMANGDQKSVNVLHSLEISEIAHQHLWEQLKRYLVVGGLPEVVQTYCENKEHLYEALTLVREKQETLLAAYFADMAKHSGKTNAMHLDRIFRAVPTQLEKQQDDSVAKFKFKGVVPGISHYERLANAIEWLTQAGLVSKIQIVESGLIPLKARTKENAFKLLLFDIGILGSMCGLAPKVILDHEYGSYKGYFIENYVAQELICTHNRALFCWIEKSAEVEFLMEVDGDVIPIEVKAGKRTRAKSLQIFAQKYKPSHQIVLSANALNLKTTQKLYPLYLAGFLFIT